MSIFAISDLHLSFGVDKPMDIFGDDWKHYMTRIEDEWKRVVGEEDTVLIPGDISWAMNFEEALPDFEYLERLPGNKVMVKGNHDYWWSTQSKNQIFLKSYGFKTLTFLYNSSLLVDDVAVCGTRGWVCPGDENYTSHDLKVYNRERNRLVLSLESIKGDAKSIIVMMHYPPFPEKDTKAGFTDILKEYNVNICVYGHLHSYSIYNAIQGTYNNIKYKLASADALKFKPELLIL